jgi:hypothetical protein
LRQRPGLAGGTPHSNTRAIFIKIFLFGVTMWALYEEIAKEHDEL